MEEGATEIRASKDDGGPAFPSEVKNYSFEQREKGRLTFYGTHPGMSLRDYFAASALTGILLADEKARQELGGDRRHSTAEEFAQAAFQMSDAMLRAREPK